MPRKAGAAMTVLPDEIRRELGASERLVWSGQPKQGFVLRRTEVLAIPFSLVWCGFAVFWEWSVLHSKAPWFFPLWGLLFVIVGLYFVAGRFYVDALMRAKTWYAITNERVIIVAGLFNRTVKSLQLRSLSDVSLSEYANGSGIITFGAASSLSPLYGGWAGWPGMQGQIGPRFDLVPNVKSVYETIRGAQKAAA
jgi:Bacterial PH domain